MRCVSLSQSLLTSYQAKAITFQTYNVLDTTFMWPWEDWPLDVQRQMQALRATSLQPAALTAGIYTLNREFFLRVIIYAIFLEPQSSITYTNTKCEEPQVHFKTQDLFRLDCPHYVFDTQIICCWRTSKILIMLLHLLISGYRDCYKLIHAAA
jgi:hypothetical protein